MWIVIEKFPEPFLCIDEDGKLKYFDTEEAANEEADECQDGKAVEI
jgi:hypothetical protein